MKVPGFEIEHLTRYSYSDAADLGELRHHESPWKPNEPYDMQMMTEMVEPENSTIVVAREVTNGTIRSTEALTAFTMGDSGLFNVGRIAYLGCVSTHPDYRGRGLFSAVWQAGLEWLDEREVSHLLFTSSPNKPERAEARKLYEKFGAKVVSDAAGTDFWRLDVQQGLERWKQLHG